MHMKIQTIHLNFYIVYIKEDVKLFITNTYLLKQKLNLIVEYFAY